MIPTEEQNHNFCPKKGNGINEEETSLEESDFKVKAKECWCKKE